jgi:hypothetical protein
MIEVVRKLREIALILSRDFVRSVISFAHCFLTAVCFLELSVLLLL